MIINILKNILKKILLPKPLPIRYKIGNIKYHNSKVDSLVPEQVEIGDNFVSAPGSIILAHDASLFIRHGVYKIGKTIIGNNVFIGANAVILPGVKLGDNVIVGAGAIVTKDVKPNHVVVGNPARVITDIDSYYKKSLASGKLIEVPQSFEKLKKGELLTNEDILNFGREVNEKF